MLQKAIIEQKLDKYSMRVRIPVYNKIKSDPTSTPLDELYIASIQTLPGCSPCYQEGDVVLVAFENDEISIPVIIGLLYRESMPAGATDIVADSLQVNVNTNLSENTLIGTVTPESIKKLNDKYVNNVKKVVVEYSLSNYEDHYDQFSPWSQEAPQYWPDKYMWQRTTVTYENDTSTRSMTCIQGAKGEPGSGITITATHVKYAISNSGTTHPSTSAQNTWYDNPPATTDVNPYLWSWTYVRYSDGTTTDSFGVSRTSANSIIVYLYKRSATTINQIDWQNNLTYNLDTKQFTSALPTGWDDSIPSGNDPIYVTAATASSVQSTCTITPAEWSTPILFTKSGFNSKTVLLYKRDTSVPAKPSSSVTYTFSSGSISPSSPNGWSLAIPTSNGNPCYVIQATAISYEDSDTILTNEWSTPSVLAQDGDSDYIDQDIVDWYKATATTVVPTTPTSDIEVATEWTSLGWTNNISSIVLSDTNKYLWNAEVTHYSISGYVKTNAHIITVYAEAGTGIASSTIYYFVDTQGATPPSASAAWSTTFPSSIQQGQYLWTKTVTSYTDTSMSDTVAYSVSRDGETGTDGKGIVSVVEYYAINDSATTPPASGSSDWQTTPITPTSSNRYLWSYQTISYTTGSPTTTSAHVISMYSEDGTAGSNAATVFLYQRAASASSLTKPSGNLTYTFSTGILTGSTIGNWSQTIPATDGNPCFMIQAAAIAVGDTDTITSNEWSSIIKILEDGQPGTPGVNGLNNALVYLYKRSSTAATVDWTETLTYNFSNKSLTSTPSGWSENIPSGTDPIYVTAATASSNTNTDSIPYTEWVTPVVLAQNGEDGTNGRSITSVVNYYLATNVDTGVTRSTPGWTTTIQNVTTNNKYLWNYEEITYSSGSPTYTDPCIIGAYGDDGQTGVGISDITEYYALSTTTTRPSTGWSTTLPTMDATNRYLWNYSVITYTNGNTSGTVNDALIIGVYGESTLSLEIESSNGTLFNSKTTSTVLTAAVYLGVTQLTVSNSGAVTSGGVTIGQLNWVAKEQFIGNGTATTFDLGLTILDYSTTPDIEITIDGVATSAYTVTDADTITFTSAPANNSVVIIKYLTSSSSSLIIDRTDVRNQIIITCKVVSGASTLSISEITIKDLNDATSLQSWYMLTVDNVEFVSEPSVIYNPLDYTVLPTGEYIYDVSGTPTTISFKWQETAPVVNDTNLEKTCYTFQMIIFTDGSCSAGMVQRYSAFDSAVTNYIQAAAANSSAEDAQNAADNAQTIANSAVDGVNTNAEEIENVRQTLMSLNGILAAKLDTVTFTPYQTNIDSFMQFDVANGIMTIGSGNFKQQLSSTKNSFYEGTTEVAYISNRELYINNATINEKLALDQQWVITFDSTYGLLVNHL